MRETVNYDNEKWIGDTKKIILMRKKVWCHAISIPCCESVIFWLNSFEFCWTAFEMSVFLYFSVPQCEGWLWLLFDLLFENWTNSCRKWQSPSQIWLVEQQNHAFSCQLNWFAVLEFSLFTSNSWIVCDWSSPPLIPLCPLAGLRPPSKIPSFSHSASLSLLHLYRTLPQNTTPDLVLSQCWCSLTVTHTQPQWVYGMVRVPRDLDCPLLTLKRKSLVRDQKKITTQTQFSIGMMRETVNYDHEKWIGDTKKIILMRKNVWCHAISIPCCESVIFLLNFFEFCWTAFEMYVFLYFSVPQCEGWLWLCLIRCSKLSNSCRKWQSPLRFE